MATVQFLSTADHFGT